jgi:16S rRNA (cytosine967-C5)-methyltransferase
MQRKSSKQDVNPRNEALRVLQEFNKNPGHLDRMLENRFANAGAVSERDRAFISHLVRGVVRYREQLDFVISQFSNIDDFERRSLKAALMRLGTFQLMPDSRVPKPAAINESVELARRALGANLTGYVNAVLRRISEAADRWEELLPNGDSDTDLSARYCLPEWIIRELRNTWDRDRFYSIVSSVTRRLRLTIRQNSFKCSIGELTKALVDDSIEYEVSQINPSYYEVLSDIPAIKIRAIQEGLCFVQNASSGIVVDLLNPLKGQRILEMCAAPGGKTAAIASLTGDPRNIIANDIERTRCDLLASNLERLGIEGVNIHVGPGESIQQGEFDAILIDAPCSGLGTLAKHPEIKYIQKPENIAKLASVQSALLDNAARLLAQGGVIVYSVCTMTKRETVDVRDEFLSSHNEFVLDVPDGFLYHQFVSDGSLLVIPGNSNLEGMFAFRARKTT